MPPVYCRVPPLRMRLEAAEELLPNGVGARGLPTSLQFMGRAWEENRVLDAARAYQSLTDWHTRHPKLD